MKIKRILVAVLLAGFSPLSAPLAMADESPSAEVRVDQSTLPEFPAGDSNRNAAPEDIRWLAEQIHIQWMIEELRWEENERRWEENQRQLEQIHAQLEQIRAEMAIQTNLINAFMAVVVIQLMIIFALLWRRGNDPRAGAPEKTILVQALQRRHACADAPASVILSARPGMSTPRANTMHETRETTGAGAPEHACRRWSACTSKKWTLERPNTHVAAGAATRGM